MKTFFNFKKISFLATTLILIVVMFASAFPASLYAAAGIPKLINFQGRLMDSTGALLGSSSGTDYCYKFSIYDASTGGSKIWPSGSPSTDTIPTRNGVFDATIGSVDTLDLTFTDDQAYVDVQVATKVGATCAPGDGAESFETLSPRPQIVSSGFAINSGTVGGFTPAQSATNNQIPVLTSGALILGHATTAGINSTGANPLTVDAGTTGILNLNNNSSGNILFSNGVGSTGCTLTGASGAFACTAGGSFSTLSLSGAISGATGISSSGTINFSGLTASSAVYTDGSKNLTSTAPTSGTIGYWSRTGTVLSPSTAGDDITTTGVVTITKSSATAFTVANTGTDYGFQVDTSGGFGTGLKIASATAGNGVALSAISSGANENLILNAKGSGQINIGGSSTGDILIGGGSGSSGCTITNAVGSLACTLSAAFAGNSTFANNATSSSSGVVGVTATSSSNFTPGLYNSYTQTATGSLTAGYGFQNFLTSSAVVAGGGVGQTLYGIQNIASKFGADTATGTYNLYASYNAADNTGRTDVGIVNTYGGYFNALGDTAGTSTAIGLYATASGADNNYPGLFMGGKVGIGTVSPSELLDITGSSDVGMQIKSTTDDTAGISFINDNYRNWSIGLFSSLGDHNFAIRDLTANAVRFHIGSTGNVGISTTAADRRLEINDASGNNLRLTYNDSDGTAANYADFTMSSGGDLTIAPSGGDTNITGNIVSSSLTSAGTECLQANASGVISKTGSACGGGLTVGTTAIASGGANRVLFENGSNVLSESANFTYDGTALTVANTATTGAQLAITNTGVYTGTGIFNLTANSATTGTLGLITSSSLTTGSLLSLTSNGTAAGASQTGLNISLQGANASSSISSYGAQITNTHTGTGSNNNGILVTASGGSGSNTAISAVAFGNTIATAGSFDARDLTGTTTTQRGINIVAGPQNTGTGATTVTGINLQVGSNNNGGTVTTAYGIDASLGAFNSASITTGSIIRAYATDAGAATYGTLYGLNLSNWGTLSATTTYGIYMDTSIDQGSTRYALYSSSTSNSYMAGNLSLGSTTFTSLFNVGSAAQFQVNSSGAIAAATGVTSSGTITFSGLGGSGTQCLQTNNSGVISGTGSACGGGGSSRLDQILAATLDDTDNDNTNKQISWDWSTPTTQNAFTLTNSGTGLTSGSLFKVSSASTGAVSNGIVQFLASGAYTSTGGLLNVTANSTATGTVAKISGTGLTTGKLLDITAGTALTTGTALNVTGASYNPGNGNTGNIINLAFTNASSTGTSAVTGINIAPTISASTVFGVESTYGIRIQDAAGTPGAGNQAIYGLRIGNQGLSGAEDSYALFIDAQSGSASSNYAAYLNGNTIIDSAGLNFSLGAGQISMAGPSGSSIVIDDSSNIIDINGFNASSNFGGVIDKANSQIKLGDGGGGTGTRITLDDANRLIDFNNSSLSGDFGGYFDSVNKVALIGDNSLNLTHIKVDDSGSEININNGGGVTYIGDTDLSVNTTRFTVDDATASFNFTGNSSAVVNLLTTSGSFGINLGDHLGPDTDLSYNLGSTNYRFSNVYTAALSGGAGNLALSTSGSNGNISFAPNGTGSVQITSGVTTGTTTSSAVSIAANSLTSGTGLYIASSTLSSGSLVNLQVSGTAGASSQKAINVATTGAITGTQTTYGGYYSNTHSGGTSTNVGFYATASGGTNNYAGIFDSGRVGIGTTTPGYRFHISAGTDTTASTIDFDGWNGAAYTTGLVINSTSGVGYFPTHLKFTNAGYATNGKILTGDVNGMYFTSDGLSARHRFGDVSYTVGTLSTVASEPTLLINNTPAADKVGIAIQAHASQSVSLQEWRNSGGTPLSVVDSAGKFGLFTTAPDRPLEVNSATGLGLRLTYNDSNGSATNYADLQVGSAGEFNILPSGFITNVGGGTTRTALRFLEPSGTGTDYAAIQSNANVTTSYTWTLPAADASGCIQSNGSGTLSIASCGGGGGLTVGTTAIASGGASRILFEGAGNVLQEAAGLTWDNTDASLVLTTSSTTAANKALNVSQTGATSGTDYAGYFSNTGAATTNVGIYATASGGTTNIGLNVDAGQTLLGGTTLTTGTLAKLNIVSTMASNGSTTAIAGIHGDYTFNNGGTAGYVQVGNRFVFNNAPTTNANTMVGETIRTVDNTSLANLVRGIDITSNAGSNTAGTNVGLRAVAGTFGVQAITSGLAGGVALPAGLYAENTGTTQGDVARFYTGTMTSAAAMLDVYHDTSTFTGDAMLMDMAVGSGTFSGNFLNLKNASVLKFKVTSAGVVSMGLSGTASTNAVCSSLANTTAPTAGTAYEIRDCNAAPAADYAEMYPVDFGVTYGDIVVTGTQMVNTYDTTDGNVDWNKVKGIVTRLKKSNTPYQRNVIGIVVDNYGDFTSAGHNIKDADNPMPVALNGRVPVKVSSSSAEILPGDYLTTSSESGKATKAVKAGVVIGKAIESWSPNSGKATVMVYVEQGYFNGESIHNYTGLTLNGSVEDSALILAKILSDQPQADMLNISELLTDRLVAGLEVVTPRLTASAIDTETLTVSGDATFAGLTIMKGDSETLAKIIFDSEVQFNLPPIFNKDTAGFAIVKEGDKSVRVEFEQPYATTPVVTASMSFEATDNLDETSAQSLLDQNITSLVINKDETGFTIILNKNAPQNIRFSWIALGVKDATVFESLGEGLEITTDNLDQNSGAGGDEEVAPDPEPSGEPDITPDPEVSPEPEPSPEPSPEPDPAPVSEPE